MRIAFPHRAAKLPGFVLAALTADVKGWVVRLEVGHQLVAQEQHEFLRPLVVRVHHLDEVLSLARNEHM